VEKYHEEQVLFIMSYCFTEESRDLEESELNISLENDITSG